jgi:hypothetical protein
MPIRVVNKKTHRPGPDDLYIGRPSKWGNPFTIGRDGSREDVVRKYAEWVVRQPGLMGSLHELRGRTLVCWCAPEMCHGHVLQIVCEEAGIDKAA